MRSLHTGRNSRNSRNILKNTNKKSESRLRSADPASVYDFPISDDVDSTESIEDD